MASVFKTREIFELADQIEKAGAEFYKEAALRTEGDVKVLLTKLAELEQSHQSYFESLKHAFGLNGVDELIDMHSDAGMYLSWIAQGHVAHHLRDFFSDNHTFSVIDIIKKAIEFEKDTVVYFTALKAALVNDDERTKVEMIILEESSHVGFLSQKLRELEN